MPAWHVWPVIVVQFWPALPPVTPQPAVAPQYVLLVSGLMHAVPQMIWPTGQAHVPAWHVRPVIVVQFWPALPPVTPQPAVAPQYVLLVSGLMQLPPHEM